MPTICSVACIQFFDTTPSGWGATYHAHPVAMSCAYECIKHSLDIDLLGQVAKVAPVLEEEIGKLVEKHPSVKHGRAFGMFGAVDFWGADGKDVQLLQGPPAPRAAEFRAAMLDNGVHALMRTPILHFAPPLVIEEGELRDAFSRVSKAIAATLDKDFA